MKHVIFSTEFLKCNLAGVIGKANTVHAFDLRIWILFCSKLSNNLSKGRAGHQDSLYLGVNVLGNTYPNSLVKSSYSFSCVENPITLIPQNSVSYFFLFIYPMCLLRHFSGSHSFPLPLTSADLVLHPHPKQGQSSCSYDPNLQIFIFQHFISSFAC